MCQTSNCHIKHSDHNNEWHYFNNPNGKYVYCGRGKGIYWNPLNCTINDKGYFGNPIAIGKRCPICKQIHVTGGDTLLCFEKYLIKRLQEYDFKKYFASLRGKILVCFCKPNPCHTDIMIKYLNGDSNGK